MGTSRYFDAKKFNKDYRNGYFINVSEDKLDQFLVEDDPEISSSGLTSWSYHKAGPLKPEVLELLEQCRPYVLRRNPHNWELDFYFMWPESYNLFKLSFDI